MKRPLPDFLEFLTLLHPKGASSHDVQMLNFQVCRREELE